MSDREMLWMIVDILGGGGGDKFCVANDPLQDNDGRVMALLKGYLEGDDLPLPDTARVASNTQIHMVRFLISFAMTNSMSVDVIRDHPSRCLAFTFSTLSGRGEPEGLIDGIERLGIGLQKHAKDIRQGLSGD